jgi:hypothetical protein
MQTTMEEDRYAYEKWEDIHRPLMEI